MGLSRECGSAAAGDAARLRDAPNKTCLRRLDCEVCVRHCVREVTDANLIILHKPDVRGLNTDENHFLLS